MSDRCFDPCANRRRSTRGLPVHRRLCACEPRADLAVVAARLDRDGHDAVVRAISSAIRSAVTPLRDGIVVAPADGRVARIDQRRAACRTGPWDAPVAAGLDLHERVRLPREPQPGGRPRSSASSITPASSSMPISTRRARTTSAMPSSSRPAGGAHRRRADRRPGGAAHRVVRAEGQSSAPANASA